MTLSRLRSLERGKLVGVYCIDVSEAFDRVCEARFGQKLHAVGFNPKLLAVLLSWLGPRVSEVVVDGTIAARRALRNAVCQDTVLGPWLWDVHFCGAAHAVRAKGFLEVVFADDLNCVREFGVDAARQSSRPLRASAKHSYIVGVTQTAFSLMRVRGVSTAFTGYEISALISKYSASCSTPSWPWPRRRGM